MEKPQTLEQWIARLGITLESTPTGPGPLSDPNWEAYHFACTVKRGSRSFTCPYSAGMGIGERWGRSPAARPGIRAAWERVDARDRSKYGDALRDRAIAATRMHFRPEVVDVIACLLSDCDALDSGGLETWASDYGYDPDSRKAEAIYRTCIEQALAFRAMVGPDELETGRELAREL